MASGGAVVISNLRNRVTFERRSLTQDATGGQSETWTVIMQVWAAIEALTGRELEAAQAVRATDSHVVTVRYIPRLTAKDRMTYVDPDGVKHIYNLTDVIDVDKRHRYQQCTAVEGLATG